MVRRIGNKRSADLRARVFDFENREVIAADHGPEGHSKWGTAI